VEERRLDVEREVQKKSPSDAKHPPQPSTCDDIVRVWGKKPGEFAAFVDDDDDDDDDPP
jgi:hypothetical protein